MFAGCSGAINAVEAPNFKASLAFAVNPFPIIKGILPPALISSVKVFGLNLNVDTTFPSFKISPAYGLTVITSPVSKLSTFASIGKHPESSAVLKKIGAMIDPITTPPVLLFGTPGISLPICHWTELIPDFLELPVPTTSPTYANGWPFAFNSAIFSKGFSILDCNIAVACNGISALVNATVAGDRSSVFVSPGIL